MLIDKQKLTIFYKKRHKVRVHFMHRYNFNNKNYENLNNQLKGRKMYEEKNNLLKFFLLLHKAYQENKRNSKKQ